MGYKKVMTWDSDNKIFRIARITWVKGLKQDIGKGKTYSAKLSLGICPKLFSRKARHNELTICLFGVRVHFAKSYGGLYV